MRIVHVFKDFYPPLPAGITRYIADVSEAMAKRGHEVTVHVAGVRHARRDRLATGVEVDRHRELVRVLSMPIAPGLLREVRRARADVIHVHMPNPLGELATLMSSVPKVVCTFHARLGRQEILEPLYRPLREQLLGRAACIVVSSGKMVAAPELADHAEKIRILPYGIPAKLLGAEADRSRDARVPLQVLFVGRLVYYKGLDVLLRALVHAPEAALRVVGEGPERAKLDTLARELGVAPRVQFLGSVPDARLVDEYRTADVFVLPSVSRAEAFGMAMAEAMGNGLPVVSTALGTGTDWVNADGMSGLVVQPGDSVGLAGAIKRLGDPEMRRRLSLGARERARELFSFERHVDAIESVYRGAAP